MVETEMIVTWPSASMSPPEQPKSSNNIINRIIGLDMHLTYLRLRLLKTKTPDAKVIWVHD